MDHVHWWLFALSFVTGLVLTLALRVRPVKRQVPVGATSAHGATTDTEPERPTTVIPVEQETVPVAEERPTTTISAQHDLLSPKPPAAEEPATTKIPAAEEPPTAMIPVEQPSEVTENPPADEPPATTPAAEEPPKPARSFRRFLPKRARPADDAATEIIPIDRLAELAELPADQEPQSAATELPADQEPTAMIPVEPEPETTQIPADQEPTARIPVEPEPETTEIPVAPEPPEAAAEEPRKTGFSFLRGLFSKPEPTVEKAPTGKRPAAKKAPAKKARPGAKGSPTKKTPAGKRPPPRKVPPGKRPPGAKARPAKPAPAAAQSETKWTPVLPYEPYGPGSARATPDGGGPAGWVVKGRSDTRLYYTPDDPAYDPTVAQVWFKDEAAAARACFTPWRKSSRR
ncbi:hypothetical protein [Mycobacterium sp. 1245805.9]|uniref:channel accessory protein ArfC, sunset domain variant n=1 Tax=Mycobacterium sp. 1245805.9 TaxID=1856862 RepID=UPI000AE8BDF8